MKYLLIFLTLLTAKKCAHHSAETPLFYKATLQNWSGGVEGSGNGTYFNFYLNIPKKTNIVFDSVWVSHRRVPVQIFDNMKSGDTSVVHAEIFNKPIIKEDGTLSEAEYTEVSFPIETTAQAVLGYFIDGKRVYLSIDQFVRLQPLAYP